MAIIPRNFNLHIPLQEIRTQWEHPGDVLSVLLILGGDVIQRALAQLAGSWLTPVSFSFGWVAYSVSALVSAAGDNKLLPPPDFPAIVINGKTGYLRQNQNWIIGRLMRDYEYWMDHKIHLKLAEIVKEARKHEMSKHSDQNATIDSALLKVQQTTVKSKAGLCVSVYRASSCHVAGEPIHDLIYFSGLLVTLTQIGLATIPCVLFGDWSILMTTVAGNILALTCGSLSQWRAEKWACRKQSSKTTILTGGNGVQHAVVIQGRGHGLDFEDLAAGSVNSGASASITTRVVIALLALLWILLLITVSGQKANSWFLLAIGGLGIVHNVAIAGWPRRPEHFGVHIEFVEVIGSRKVMDTLFEVEAKYPHVGAAMVATFFPGKLRSHEEKLWADCKKLAEEKQEEPMPMSRTPVNTQFTGWSLDNTHGTGVSSGTTQIMGWSSGNTQVSGLSSDNTHGTGVSSRNTQVLGLSSQNERATSMIGEEAV